MPRGTSSTSQNGTAEKTQLLQEKLNHLVPRIFEEAQTAATNHKKNVVKLHKLHLEAAECKVFVKKGKTEGYKQVGEKIFGDIIVDMLTRVLKVKKGVRPADNIGKFFGEYIRHINEKAIEARQENEDEADDDESTTASRFTTRILRLLFKGFEAADKTPRYRTTHFVAEMVSHLGEIDMMDYNKLKKLLIGRIADKEASIRGQTALALCRLCKTDDEVEAETESSDEDEDPVETEILRISDHLIDSMRHDPSSEVRKVVLERIPISDETLPFMLERARDIDVTVRKMLYKRLYDDALILIPTEAKEDPETASSEAGPSRIRNQLEKIMGFTHPRALSIQHREDIIRFGLRDREPSIKAAATRLLAYWVEIIYVGYEEQKSSYPGLTTSSDVDPVKKEEDDGRAAARALRGDNQELTEMEKEATCRILDFLSMLDLAEPVRKQDNDDEEEKGQLGKQEEDSLAAEALLSVFTSRPDLLQDLKFVDAYWRKLTPESAFLARVFVDHCKSEKDEARLTDMLPDVIDLAQAIQNTFNQLMRDVRFNEQDEVILVQSDEDEELQQEEMRKNELTLIEMMKLAVNMDYADLAGRNAMFTLMRDMLSQDDLPLVLIPKCLDVLRGLASSEKDLIRIVVEIVQDLRNPEPEDPFELEQDPDASFGDSSSTRRRRRSSQRFIPIDEGIQVLSAVDKKRKDDLDLRCLDICIGVLERVNGKMEDNLSLDGIVKELIIPTIKRSELVFRKKGLVALGLCCLISWKLAKPCILLYRREYQQSPSVAVKQRILKVVFDILMAHDRKILQATQPEDEGGEADLVGWLKQLFGEEEDAKVQALLAMGIAKLVLAGMIQDKDVLSSLVLSYFSVDTASNQELRQCLTYFFQVYCYSSPANQKNMQEVFAGTFMELSKERKKSSEEEAGISSAQVAALFLAWTDPTKLVTLPGSDDQSTSETQDAEFIHLYFAMDIFKAILKPNHYSKAPLEKDDIKVLYQLLSRLHLPESVDDDQIRQLRVVMDRIPQYRPFRDATSRNAYNKFRDSILKKYAEQLEEMTEENFRKLEMYTELFEFLDDIIPLDGDEEPGMQTRNKSKKRRSCSIITNVTDKEDAATSTGTVSGRRQSRSKRPRMSTSEGYDSDIVETSPPPTARPKPQPQKAKNKPKEREIIEISSDSDDDVPRAPAPRRRDNSMPAVKQEAPEPEVDNSAFEPGAADTPEPEQTFDSIMDTTRASDSEDDEDEVNDLLAGDI